MALLAQPPGSRLGLVDREAVDDPRAGQLLKHFAQPGQAMGVVGQVDHRQTQRLAVERRAQHQGVVAELGGDVVGDPGVGGGGGRQHRGPRRQLGEQRAQAAVVGAEVMAPVGDAVGLVAHQGEGAGPQRVEHPAAEAAVGQTLGGNQQQIDLVGGDPGLQVVPGVDVGGVDRHRSQTEPFGGGHLVAHQGEQWGDDDGGPPAPVAQHAGGREVHRRLAEAGAGDQQGALSPGDDCGHRVELLGAGVGVGPGERPNVGGELVGDLSGGGAGRFGERGHLSTVPMPGDSRTGGRCRPASTLLTSAPLRPYLQGREANSAAIASYTTR